MTYGLRMGRKFPKITVDLEKCTVPFLCKKCLQECPMCVFHVTRVMSKEKRLEEMDPGLMVTMCSSPLVAISVQHATYD